MQIEQIYTGCLAQGAYFIVSKGEAAVIDPLREIQPYLDRAEREGVKIKYVLETHFHADFVSGHLDLAQATGAKIIYGPMANPAYEVYTAKDGEILTLGEVTIEVLHTPGHTMESTCYLLRDAQNQPHALFSGDTLFIGDVGRPDLAQKAAFMTQEQLAATLFHSLRTKIMTLPDAVIVYPAHGAGSACGKNMSSERNSTIGQQKVSNYALRADMTEEEFVKEVTDGLLPPPAYFPMNVAMNKNGYENFASVLNKGSQKLSPEAFELVANETDALILDTRPAAQFCQGFIPNAINIGLDGQFAPWVGALIPDVKQPILLVTEAGKETESITRLSRVGYDNVVGCLENGWESWVEAGKEIDTVHRITPETFENEWSAEATVIDVRRITEFDTRHVHNAKNLPLDNINDNMPYFPQDKPFFLHCQGGYRSMIAASILKSRGIHHFTEVSGGFAAISKTNITTESTVPTM